MAHRRSLWFGLFAVAIVLWVCPPVNADDNYAGTYQCAGLVVNGHSGRCASPPLVLYGDGTYKIWGEQGTYRIDGNQLKLSESKKHGRGRLLRGRQIVFKFSHRGKKHKVTFLRCDPLEAGTAII